MREEMSEISHQFDIWHVCKNIKQTLLAASKKNLVIFCSFGQSQYKMISGGLVPHVKVGRYC